MPKANCNTDKVGLEVLAALFGMIAFFAVIAALPKGDNHPTNWTLLVSALIVIYICSCIWFKVNSVAFSISKYTLSIILAALLIYLLLPEAPSTKLGFSKGIWFMCKGFFAACVPSVMMLYLWMFMWMSKNNRIAKVLNKKIL